MIENFNTFFLTAFITLTSTLALFKFLEKAKSKFDSDQKILDSRERREETRVNEESKTEGLSDAELYAVRQQAAAFWSNTWQVHTKDNQEMHERLLEARKF
eukprot:snap_masked-scaffold_13-processed-gene-6.34-mRNA-1 protein AED:1.00 eAED:1.00 QI:0/-1/0/0/-1/1/1/0/100